MGWSSADMTKRYQHVTDSIRADVAGQVGDLIWKARDQTKGEQSVLVRRDSLAAILSLVEDAIVQEGVDSVDLAKLQAAIGDLRTAMVEANRHPEGEGK